MTTLTTRRQASLIAFLLTLITLAVLVMPFTLTWRWREGSRHGDYVVAFDGFGEVRGNLTRIEVAPRPVRERDRTSAALVVTERSYRDVDLTATVQTTRQLRLGSEPNPWEVGWLLWRYQDRHRFYALALKPNGWEISKQDRAYPGSQRFLASGEHPAFPVGQEHEVRVVMHGDEITAWVDGEYLTTVVDDEYPYREGKVGFYAEDAAVTYSAISVENAPGKP